MKPQLSMKKLLCFWQLQKTTLCGCNTTVERKPYLHLYFTVMRCLLFFAALFFCHIGVSAQANRDSMRMQYQLKTIRLGNRISMNGIVLEKRTVQNLMLLSPEATGYYKQYIKSRTAGNTLPIFATAAVVTGLFMTQKNRTSGNLIVISGNIVHLAAALFRRKASNHLQDAVWTYNRDVLYPQK